MNNNVITIRLSIYANEAYRFLQSKNINAAILLKKGGEQLVIQEYEKYNRPKLITIKQKYF
jgi:hypothetical protein